MLLMNDNFIVDFSYLTDILFVNRPEEILHLQKVMSCKCH